MQAIQTKYLCPTNHRDARIIAQCAAAKLTIPWDDSANVEHNHFEAARQLAIKLGWTKKYHGALWAGTVPCNPGGYVFVFVNDDSKRHDNFAGYAPDILCPHGPHDLNRTTNDCQQCHDDRKVTA